MDEESFYHTILEEEILGPILPILEYNNNDELYKANNITKEAFLNNKEIEVSKIDSKNEAVLVTGLPVNTNYENDSQEDSQETGIYSLNYTQNFIKLWKDFIETNYAVMKRLYKSINGNTFSPISINKKLNIIFDMFKKHIQEKENNNIDIDNKENGNDETFKYCKSLITFWLYEFAYTCRDCNQVKCDPFVYV